MCITVISVAVRTLKLLGLPSVVEQCIAATFDDPKTSNTSCSPDASHQVATDIGRTVQCIRQKVMNCADGMLHCPLVYY